MKDDTCLICGTYVPEGRQVCPACEPKNDEWKTDQGRRYRGFAFICSPYRGKVKRNTKYAAKLTRWAILEGYIPVTPHLYITQALDDNKPKERALGINVGATLLRACDTIIVGMRYGISDGMRTEISLAETGKIRIIEVYKVP